MGEMKRRPYGEVKALIVIGASVAAYFATDHLLKWRYGRGDSLIESLAKSGLAWGASFLAAWLTFRLFRRDRSEDSASMPHAIRAAQRLAAGSSVGRGEWFILIGNKGAGPFTVAEMRAIAADGTLRLDTFVRKGPSGWGYAQDDPILAAMLGAKSTSPALESRQNLIPADQTTEPLPSVPPSTQHDGGRHEERITSQLPLAPPVCDEQITPKSPKRGRQSSPPAHSPLRRVVAVVVGIPLALVCAYESVTCTLALLADAFAATLGRPPSGFVWWMVPLILPIDLLVGYAAYASARWAWRAVTYRQPADGKIQRNSAAR
jgi:hypothetical protein